MSARKLFAWIDYKDETERERVCQLLHLSPSRHMLAHAWSQCLELTSLIKQVGVSLIIIVLKDRKKVEKQASHTEKPKGNTNSCDSKVNMTIKPPVALTIMQPHS